MIKSAAKSQKTLFFFENKKDIFSAISEFLFLFKIYCQRKRKIKTDKTILKTIVFPQSGGENQGGKLSRGRATIKQNPIK